MVNFLKNVLLLYLIANYISDLIKSYRYLVNRTAYNVVKDEIEKVFNVQVQNIFTRDGKTLALVYDPVTFAYYEMALDHKDEPANPFDSFMDEMEFGNDD